MSGADIELERYRPLLLFLAQLHLDPRLKSKLDPADVVQETFAQAWAGLEDFRGKTEGEREAWLRTILARTLLRTVRTYLHQQKANVNRERSLHEGRIPGLAEASSVRIGDWLAAEQSTPSERAMLNEEALRLASAMEELPEAQKEALILQHWYGLSLAEIGAHLGRSRVAVAGLIKRGVRQLRERMIARDHGNADSRFEEEGAPAQRGAPGRQRF
jgi:RNA polymerase sigma-70 factor (ECF subfamily)